MNDWSVAEAFRQWLVEERKKRTLQDWVIDLGPFAMLFLLSALFTTQSDAFLTYRNLVGNVARNSAVLLIVALAGTFPILQQSIDLSVASIVSLAGVTTAMLVPDLGLLALLAGVLVGLVAGLVNGLVFVKLKVPSFLVTLGTLSVMGGVAKIITGGFSVTYRNEAVREIAIGTLIPGVPNLVLVGFVIYLLTTYLAWRTKLGRYCYALGENERVVDLSGVKVNRYKIAAFVLSGILCGIAGALLASRIGSGSPTMGDGLLLPSLAAVVMGGTALTGGVGGTHRTILGVLVIVVLRNGMNLVQIQPFVQEVIVGIVVVGAVAMSIDRRKIDLVK